MSRRPAPPHYRRPARRGRRLSPNNLRLRFGDPEGPLRDVYAFNARPFGAALGEGTLPVNSFEHAARRYVAAMRPIEKKRLRAERKRLSGPWTRNRKKVHYQELYVGYVFEGTRWELLEMPRRVFDAKRRAQRKVIVRCLGCERVFDRRLGHIITKQSRSCRSCSMKGNQRARRK